ncbi:MAG TPA: indole-3-glycerol phosphate synthase TrpC [Acidimicrobiales bacterium]
MATYLDRILAAHRTAAQADDRPVGPRIEAAAAMAPARPFVQALRESPHLAVIAEIKRRSPSRGELAPGLDPAAMARAYASGGAVCLSVLTDEEFFGGTPADLAAARAACALPTLRKDFTLSEGDVVDARLMGADAVLLIAAALDDAELRRLHGLATEVGLAALVEVHDHAELERAAAVGAVLIGVNQRDLVTFEVDHARAEQVGAAIPAGVVRVAESGIRDAADACRLAEAGFDAVLVGETLVRAIDPAAVVRALGVARLGQGARPCW